MMHLRQQVVPAQPKPPKQPTLMESYNFNYSYVAHPLINNVPTAQSYIGTGFAPVGTYKPGQTINVADAFGRSVGTYTIGNVNDKLTFNAQQLNHLNIVEYDYGVVGAASANRFIVGTGLGTGSGGAKGLGSEAGSLIGFGAFGTNVTFNNQHTAINPIHF